MEEVKSYRRQYRRQQARRQVEETRGLVIAAARKLFARAGYVATTIEAIAQEAGVAVQTVYSNFGSKSRIFEAVVDLGEVEPDLLDIVTQFASANSDPQRQVRLAASFNRTFFERLSDVFDALPGAAAADASLAALRERQEDARRERCRLIVAGWVDRGQLRSGLDPAEAADTMFALAGPEVFRLLVRKAGWSPERYERWVAETLESLLVD